MLVDHLSFTAVNDPFEIMKDIGGEFVKMARGLFGYPVAYKNQLGAIVAYHPERPEMKRYVQLPGKTLAMLQVEKILDWARALTSVKFTRVDIAFDSRSVPIATIVETPIAGNCKGMSRKIECFKTGGVTAYYGSTSGEMLVRAYDKAAEQKVDGVWSRLEYQCRGSAADHLVKSELPAGRAPAFLQSFLRFVKNDDSRRSRCSLAGWFEDLTAKLEKCKKRAKAAFLEVLTKKEKWFENQIAGMVRQYIEADQLERLLVLAKREGKVSPSNRELGAVLRSGKEKINANNLLRGLSLQLS